MQEREITSRIRRDELQGLLDTSADVSTERITARIPAVTLAQLLEPEEPPELPTVTFRRPRASERMRPIRVDDIDAVIDAAVDAAIDAEIHNAEIDAAIDAVVRPESVRAAQPHYAVVALSFAFSLFAGIVIMALL